MKSLLLIALIMFVSCETTEESDEIIAFYKCLLLDSDTVYNHISSLVDSILTLDPVLFATTFTTIYPAIVLEVTRCNLLVEKNFDNEIVLKNTSNNGKTLVDFLKAIIKAVITYAKPFLNSLGINLQKICNEYFPNTSLCDLLE